MCRSDDFMYVSFEDYCIFLRSSYCPNSKSHISKSFYLSYLSHTGFEHALVLVEARSRVLKGNFAFLMPSLTQDTTTFLPPHNIQVMMQNLLVTHSNIQTSTFISRKDTKFMFLKVLKVTISQLNRYSHLYHPTQKLLNMISNCWESSRHKKWKGATLKGENQLYGIQFPTRRDIPLSNWSQYNHHVSMSFHA